MSKKRILLIASASIIGLCLLLTVIGSLLPDPPDPTPTQPGRNQSIDLDEPTWSNTPTTLPTDTLIPPTNTLRPTNTKSPTYTPTLAKLNPTATKSLIKPTATKPTRIKPTATTKPIKQPTATKSSTKCHKSYPTVCIPPPPPDLDCKDISYRNFKVVPPDPHNFDGDGNGVGCES